MIFLFTTCPSTFQKLFEEIEKNKDKVDECQKHAKAYIDAIKVCVNVAACMWFMIYGVWVAVWVNVLMQDYELQLVTYKALAEPIASPLKKTKIESVSDDIIQEVPLISDILQFFYLILINALNKCINLKC